MGVPIRFALEYPQRVLHLISGFERQAREEKLVGSFALLAAALVLTIPYERLRASHFLKRAEDDEAVARIKALKKIKFPAAPFWKYRKMGTWRQSRIMNAVEDVDGWRDADDRHPLAAEAANTIDAHSVDDVLRVLRNALAHANVIYLNKDGREIEGSTVMFLAFLSRYEETEEQRAQGETYRVVTTTEDDFLAFVICWANWVQSFHKTREIVEAA